MVTIKKIIKSYLSKNKFDGLYNDIGCACLKSDLKVFQCSFSDCKPGVKKTYEELTEEQKANKDSRCDWFIVAKK